jgi:hypothetical protein
VLNIIYPAETVTFHPITDAIVGGIIVALLAYYPVLFLINLLIAIGPVVSISLIVLMPLMLILTNANSQGSADANIIMAAVLSIAVIALIASIKTIYERNRDGLPIVNPPQEKSNEFVTTDNCDDCSDDDCDEYEDFNDDLELDDDFDLDIDLDELDYDSDYDMDCCDIFDECVSCPDAYSCSRQKRRAARKVRLLKKRREEDELGVGAIF